jgi:hypothetical protein
MRRILAFCTLFALSTGAVLADPLPPQLATAFANFAGAKSYHMTVDAHGQHIDLDMVTPGKMHLTASGGRMPMEMIKIDSDTYMKLGGSWRKFSMPGMDAMVSSYVNVRALATDHGTDAKFTDLGMSAVDGAPMHAYEVLSSPTSDPTDIYVGADGMIHQMTVKGKNGPATMVFSAFNTPMTIVAPI